MRQEGIGIRLL